MAGLGDFNTKYTGKGASAELDQIEALQAKAKGSTTSHIPKGLGEVAAPKKVAKATTKDPLFDFLDDSPSKAVMAKARTEQQARRKAAKEAAVKRRAKARADELSS